MNEMSKAAAASTPVVKNVETIVAQIYTNNAWQTGALTALGINMTQDQLNLYKVSTAGLVSLK